MSFETEATITTFGGHLLKLKHESTTTKTPMSLSVFLPPSALSTPSTKVPVLYYLSGLTCTPANCSEKGFLHVHAARHSIAIIYPDTSPRRSSPLPGETDTYDFGSSAGFYINATASPWAENYHMYSYITSELPKLLKENFPVLDLARESICGHSMGGHGALVAYLREGGDGGRYKSVSAWAPIANPTGCKWGEKAFGGYLKGGVEEGKEWDATELVKGGKTLRALVNVGTGDGFMKEGQLRVEVLEEAVKKAGKGEVEVRWQKDYDHSYFFISTFAEDHVNYHAKFLCK